MIKAVLFDMDDTLLDINLMAFMTTYVADVSRILSDISGASAARFGVHLARSYLAMSNPSRVDGLTNREVFDATMERLTGLPVADETVVDALDYYDAEVLPGRNTALVSARPMPGGMGAIERVGELGLRCALATNPSFSEGCIRTRMGWAGISDAPFERVSHMGNSTRLKPRARYYEEFVAALGLRPQECLMVGNDAKRDFARPDVSLRVAYVGHARPRRAVWSGRMGELADALPALVDRLNVEGESRA